MLARVVETGLTLECPSFVFSCLPIFPRAFMLSQNLDLVVVRCLTERSKVNLESSMYSWVRLFDKADPVNH